MERTKTSKKALRSLISESMQEAIGKLDLPKSGKKIDKLISKSSKRLATVFADMIKRETKKRQKVEKSLTYVEDVLKGKKKDKKGKKEKHEKHAAAEN